MLIMIARRGTSEKDIKSIFIMNECYQIKEVSIEKVIETFKNRKNFHIENVDYNDKNGLEYTNGSANNYTLYSMDGTIINSPRGVILNRIEINNRLQGYTIYNSDGTICEISVEQAARFAANKLIANGKIRHTQQGDIVSSIGGEYPIREIKIDNVKDNERTIIPLYFASMISSVNNNKYTEYVGAIIQTDSGAVMSKAITAAKQMNNKLISELKAECGDNQQSFNELSIKTIGANSAFIVVGIDDMTKLLGNGIKKHKANGYKLSVLKLINGEMIEERAEASKDGVIKNSDVSVNQFRGVLRVLNDKAKKIASQIIE